MKHLLRLLFTLVAVSILSVNLMASGHPTAVVSYINTDSPRAAALSSMVRLHSNNILKMTNAFNLVKSDDFARQVKHFHCTEERCQLRFTKMLDIDLLINGSISDSGTKITITLQAYGISTPHNGRKLYQYQVEIPMHGGLSPKQYSYIAEEHTAAFLASLLKKYTWKVPVVKKDSHYYLQWDTIVSGIYTLYSMDSSELSNYWKMEEIGNVVVVDNKIEGLPDNYTETGRPLAVLGTFTDKSRFIADFFHGRKKEIVFKSPSGLDFIYSLLLFAPGSAAMPIAAPTLYFTFNDWEGAGLWALNSAFYIGMEVNGWVNYSEDYRNNHKNLSRSIVAGTIYTWYLFAAGGLGPVVDALSWYGHNLAANYHGVQPFLGNDLVAGFLALVSGGAGHFYRGDRLWGYIYYHVNNILVYFIIHELVDAETWNSATGSYVYENHDKTVGYALLGVYIAVKIAEVVHAVLMKDHIRNGIIHEKDLFLAPTLSLYEDGSSSLGIQVTRKF